MRQQAAARGRAASGSARANVRRDAMGVRIGGANGGIQRLTTARRGAGLR